MTTIGYLADEVTLPEVGRISDRRRRATSGESAVALAFVPAIISVTVQLANFTLWWVPEFRGLAGSNALLTQFTPLVSTPLTSDGEPLVAAQAGRSGVLALYWLLAGLAIPVFAYARFWLARLALWPVCYLAVVAAVVALIGVLVRGDLADHLLGFLALAGWLAAALSTAWRSLWVEVDSLPPRPPELLWLLVPYVLITPVPVAVGRWLFAPELRTAALDVAGAGFTLRWSALLTPATLPVYLSGLLVGVLLALAYVLLPPRLSRGRLRPAIAAALTVAGLAVFGSSAAAQGTARAEQLRTESPVDSMSFPCGSWVDRPAGRPPSTVAISGSSCRRITVYQGYRAVASRELTESASPVRARTPEGRDLEGRLIAARYGPVLVVATTSRIDNRADTVLGLRMADATNAWIYRCPQGEELALRFGGSDGGDAAGAGRITRLGERDQVTIACPTRTVRLDPATGRIAPKR